MNIKDLKANKASLAKNYAIPSHVMDALLEIIEKGKIAKPEKLFKDSAQKLNVASPKPFMFIDMGLKSYFLYDCSFPLGNEIKTQLDLVKKELKKSKDKKAVEVKKLFLDELAQIDKKIKGFAKGFIKHTDTKGNTCRMLVRQGITVSGKIKKSNLADNVLNIGYALLSKSGQKLELIPIKEEKEAITKNGPTKTTESDNTTLKSSADIARQAFKSFREIILPAYKSKKLTPKLLKELSVISNNFNRFNQVIKEATSEEESTHKKLMEAIQKAAGLIATIQPQNSGKGADIIDGDDVFSDKEKAAIKALVNAIKKGLPLVKTQVLPNLKADKTTKQDQQILSDLIDNIARFNDNYEAAPKPVKKQLGKFHATVNKQQTQLKSMLKKLDAKAQEQLNEMLTPEQRSEIMNNAKQEIDQILKELDAMKAA